ncbi:hypothetical protein HW532_07080 [Kaustia mangrovi]|uniref:arginine deiminase n=1 Tax=Kaustia mangrovi TaxID=2593653 RepID=A0A7S8C331_9HYPH|nr:arginine deiminase family protein [Kaustia mangrovi]QPC42488.1 hypothetical protein HW532_07080 [Kaustia mangrovi]
MFLGFQSDTGPLARLVVKHVRDAFVSEAKIDAEWRSLGYTARPDLARAIDQYDAFVAAIRQLAPEVEIDFLEADGTTTLDSLYPRDAAIATSKGMVLCNMGKPARAGEPAAEGQLFSQADIPVCGAISGAGHIEGGDVAWIDEHTLAVGRGYRTNEEGIRQLRALLGDAAEIVRVPMPHYRGPGDVFHLMSILSPIDRDLALVYSPLMVVPFREILLERGIGLVEVPDEEFDSMGCNVLAVAPRKCVMIDGNPVTRRRLEEAGCEVVAIDGSEICSKGAGGPTCLTRPILRQCEDVAGTGTARSAGTPQPAA